MKRIFLIISVLLCALAHTANAQQTEEPQKEKKNWKEWLPEIHGVVRGKYEYQPQINAGRFQVRNARFSLSGKVNRLIGYKTEIDLSDEGEIKMLDAYAAVYPMKGLDLRIGQMRVPFSIDAHRSPHLQYFANRSFIAKQVGNVRDVGLTGSYTFGKEDMKIILEGGIFNGSGLKDQKPWQKDMNYSFKLQLFPVKNYNLTLSTQKICPTDVTKIYLYDIGTYVDIAGFHIEAEYLYKTYEDNTYDKVHAFNSFINYDIPLKKALKKISLLCRYDMMTDQWDGETFDEKTNAPVTTDVFRHRITGGVTLSFDKPFLSDLRINYEKYFYRSGDVPKESEQDKICVEMMVRF